MQDGEERKLRKRERGFLYYVLRVCVDGELKRAREK